MRPSPSGFDPRRRIVAPALKAPPVLQPVPAYLLALLLGSGVASIVLLSASLALIVA